MIPTYQAIQNMDSNLIPREKFDGGVRNIAKVTLEGKDYLFKGAECPEQIKFLKIERKVLIKAKKLEGITHLVDTYMGKNYFAILKEYFEGEAMPSQITGGIIKKQLLNSVNYLHSQGIARLDIARRNIILSPDKKNAKIIDLDWCQFSEDCSLAKFENYKQRDLIALEDCFS